MKGRFNMKKCKRRGKLIEREKYKNFAVHFGIISGILTIIGLLYGIISYYQTVKPYIDEKKLKTEIINLEENKKVLLNENKKLVSNNENLISEKVILEKDLLDKKEYIKKIEGEISIKEEQYGELENIAALSFANDMMQPIVYSAALSDGKKDIQSMALERLEKQKTYYDSEIQLEVLNMLISFVKTEITKNSSAEDLNNYITYIYQEFIFE